MTDREAIIERAAMAIVEQTWIGGEELTVAEIVLKAICPGLLDGTQKLVPVQSSETSP